MIRQQITLKMKPLGSHSDLTKLRNKLQIWPVVMALLLSDLSSPRPKRCRLAVLETMTASFEHSESKDAMSSFYNLIVARR